MERSIVLASSNQGKLREFNQILLEWDWKTIPQTELKVPEAEETGLSFVENAILKARNASQYTNLPAMADDSGIEVDALEGQPGIYSARFAGVGATDEANLQLLIDKMQDVPEEKRTARFHCVIVYMHHPNDPMPLICQGTWEGKLLFEPKGEHGFGYDPIFYVPTHNCASAELSPEVKNQLSHRGQALRALQIALRTMKR